MSNDPLSGAKAALKSADSFQKSAGGALRHSHEYSSAPYSAAATPVKSKPADSPKSDAQKEAGDLGREVDARRANEDAVRDDLPIK